jgi:predicted molibdopterin-dependent oxidoreductase YjgC
MMDYKTTLTTCTYCGCGCNLLLESLDGKLTGTIPCKTSPVNEGKLCIKGWNIHQFVQSDKRLTRPLIRKDGKLVETDWEEALSYTAEKLKAVKQEKGGDGFGFFASAKVTNEENFLMQKLARAGLGSNNVDHCARL